MKVKKVMTVDIESITPETTIKNAAKIMVRDDIGGLIVQKNYEIVGIITEHDIMTAFTKSLKPNTPVKEVMSKGVITIDANDTLEDAAKRMLEYGVKRLPVVSKGRCVGIVTATDLITYEEHLIDKISELFMIPKKKETAAG